MVSVLDRVSKGHPAEREGTAKAEGMATFASTFGGSVMVPCITPAIQYGADGSVTIDPRAMIPGFGYLVEVGGSSFFAIRRNKEAASVDLLEILGADDRDIEWVREET